MPSQPKSKKLEASSENGNMSSSQKSLKRKFAAARTSTPSSSDIEISGSENVYNEEPKLKRKKGFSGESSGKESIPEEHIVPANSEILEIRENANSPPQHEDILVIENIPFPEEECVPEAQPKPKRKKIADKWSRRTIIGAKAGVFFDPKVIRRNLRKGKFAKTIRVGSAVYMAAVLEYLVAEVLELSGNVARANKKSSITPRHVLLGIRTDEELNALCKSVTFPQSGTLPFIHKVLKPKKN
ncbi:hypothetical protein ACFFRR_003019 [Megaselia abdita]